MRFVYDDFESVVKARKKINELKETLDPETFTFLMIKKTSRCTVIEATIKDGVFNTYEDALSFIRTNMIARRQRLREEAAAKK